MKKKFVMTLLLLAAVFNPLFASIIVDDDVEAGNQSSNRPRTGIPSVNASAMGDELTIDINRYQGNAQVTVVAQDGSSTIANTYYINGHTSFTMDFAGYAKGHYSLIINLQDGQEYYGSFRKE